MLASMPLETRDEFRSDLGLVEKTFSAGVTLKRARAQENHWERWAEFCHGHNLDPFLRDCVDPIPILQTFGQRYQDGRLAPSQRAVASRTVEDALRAIGQKYTSVGSTDPRKNCFGEIDFRVRRQLKSYAKADGPPIRVKPVPVTIVLYILGQAFGAIRSAGKSAVADMIVIAFYYLLRPGEYTGTATDDTPFRLQDILLHKGTIYLNHRTEPAHRLMQATSAAYIFTRQKNGVRNEHIVHGRSMHQHCCPVLATVRRLLHHRANNSPEATPLASYYQGGKRHLIRAKDVTDTLKNAAAVTSSTTGIRSAEITARSLRAGGAMALLCGKTDKDVIKLVGRWHSDAMMRYLHAQAEPLMRHLAKVMFNNGTYTFLPDEWVPQHE